MGCDLGLVGLDVLEEKRLALGSHAEGALEPLRSLEFGRCRLAQAVPEGFAYRSAIAPQSGPMAVIRRGCSRLGAHGLVLLRARGLKLERVLQELEARHQAQPVTSARAG
jgi:hypothetical protein